SSLVQGKDRTLFGIAAGGGNCDDGVIFKLDPDTAGYVILNHPCEAGGDGHSSKGALVEGRDGLLYGFTPNGGTWNSGTIFQLNKDGGDYQIRVDCTKTSGIG